MDRTVPTGAALTLDFIAGFEAPKGYDTVYGNRMDLMPKPLTSMTLAEVIADGPRRTKVLGSSACGRYQFMTATLQGIRKELVLMGSDLFTSDLQDRLALHLLRRRGYDKFMAGTLSMTGFGLQIAQEWASFPVLAACKGAHRSVVRGQSYYAGDGMNKALVKPEAVEAALSRAYAAKGPAVVSKVGASGPSKQAVPAMEPAVKPAPTGGLSSAAPPVRAPGWFARLRETLRTNMTKGA